MPTQRVTPAERLSLLLPWLNGKPVPDEVVSQRLSEFHRLYLARWVGDPEGEYLGIDPPSHTGPALSRRQLQRLQRDLRGMLDGTTPDVHFSTLRIAAVRVRSRPAKMPKELARRRAANGPGAFRLVVRGSLRDVTLYTFMQTLTEPGLVTLACCPAPAPGRWSERCGHFFVDSIHAGQPRTYCSHACRLRAYRSKHAKGD